MDPLVKSPGVPTPQERIGAASAAVRSWCQWHIAPVLLEENIEFELLGECAMLRTQRVVSVVSASIGDRDVTSDLYVVPSGLLGLRGGWGCDPSRVRISVKHGYGIEDIPDVLDVVRQIANRSAVPATTPDTQRAGPFQVGLGGAGAAGVSLLRAEEAKLAPYRLNWGP